MYKAIDIANYVLGYACEKEDFSMSNLKLQKVLYFLQANHLVETNNPLFEDKIEAWDFGPVIPYVYHEYKVYGGGYISYDIIDKDKKYKKIIYNKDKKIMNELLDELIPYSSSNLCEIIQNQTPWIKAYYGSGEYKYINGKLKKIKEIDNQSLYDFFKE